MMIIQEQSDHWDSSLLRELEMWERRILARPGTKKNKNRRVVQLVSPAGKVFTSSSGLFSFLQKNNQSGGSLSEDSVREEVRQLFRLREEERDKRPGRRPGRRPGIRAKEKISSTQATFTTTTTSSTTSTTSTSTTTSTFCTTSITTSSTSRRVTASDYNVAPDFSQLLPSEPLSPGELSQVERIISLEEDLVQISQDLVDLDDIDFPRLEEEQMICDVPLIFRRD